MSTTLRRLRQGLPRVPGGEPWPPPGFVEIEDRPDYLAETAASIPTVAPASTAPVAAAAPAIADAAVTRSSTVTETREIVPTEERRVPLRRGLPRTPGGDPWPPAGLGLRIVAVDGFDVSVTATEAEVSDLSAVRAESPQPVVAAAAVGAPTVSASVRAVPTTLERVPLRRGLPRTPGGEPWPPAGFGVLTVGVVADEPEPPAVVEEPPVPPAAPVLTHADSDPTTSATTPVRPVTTSTTPGTTAPRPAPVRKTAASTSAPSSSSAPLRARVLQLLRFPAATVVGAIAVVGGLFMLVSWLMSTDTMAAFLARYPGEYALPPTAEPGFPAWVRWNHFLNMFFIILIIRSGLQVRHEKQPPAYWTPRWSGFGGGKKISISLWLHQMLDVLWLLNGIVFITLLFVTGHWMRIVPTSWAVFPNALSAMLQYLSLDWPTDNGWVNYNSLQQLMYFIVVFIAAPLAALTGLRMSGLWPAKAKRLSALYPVELARAVHYPTMLFFVVFVITHVAMVFATGALRNLNHMFAGAESTNWAGFWIFVVALAVIATVWELARPMVLAPIARLLGRVTQR